MAWGNHLLTKYIKKEFAPEGYYLKDKMKFCPFLDIYRKEALEKTQHHSELKAGDHVERSLRIMDSGFMIMSHDNSSWPHWVVNYKEQSIRDLIRQKN